MRLFLFEERFIWADGFGSLRSWLAGWIAVGLGASGTGMWWLRVASLMEHILFGLSQLPKETLSSQASGGLLHSLNVPFAFHIFLFFFL